MDEQASIGLYRTMTRIRQFEKRIVISRQYYLHTGFGQLLAHLFGQQQRIFFFFIIADAIAGVPAAVARIEANGFERGTRFAF